MPDVLLSPLVLAGAAVLLVVVLFGTYLWRRGRRSERYAVFFAGAPDGLVLMNQAGRVVEVNEAACRLLGEPERKVRGRLLARLLRSEVEVSLPETRDEEVAVTAEVTHGRGAGKRIDLRIRLRSIELRGTWAYAVSLCDVTDEKEENRLFKRFHREVLAALPIECAVLSPEGVYRYVNARVIEDQQARQWLLGKTDFDFCKKAGLHPEVALRRRSHRRRAVATGETVHFEERVPFPSDGAVHRVMRSYAPVFTPDGEIFVIISYGLDITEQRLAEGQLAQAAEKAERFVQLQASYLENIGPEFRTPLAGILGAAQILGEEAADEQRELVEIIERYARRLENLLNALHDLAGLQAEDQKIRPRVVDLADAAARVVEGLNAEAQQKGIFLRLDAGKEALVRVDPGAFHRALHRLIENAIKFTGAGGVLVEVEREDHEVHVRIMDTGVGIGEDYLPHLFEAFDQERTGMDQHLGGVGVGLAVVKRLVDLMGGTIAVDSQKGDGSTFTLTLPAVFRGADGDTPSWPRVLVVEEAPADQQLMRYLLDPHVELDVVGIPEEARPRVGRGGYDAVLLNVGRGEEAGSALLASLRASEEEEEAKSVVPVIAVDAVDLPGGEEQYLPAGYDGYVPKPLDKRRLLNVLADTMARAETPV